MKKVSIVLILAVVLAAFFYLNLNRDEVYFASELYFKRTPEKVENIIEEISLPEISDSEIETPNDIKEEGSIIEEGIVQTPATILYFVPFISQAPSANWSNPIFQDACEESSVLMAISWVNDEVLDNSLAEDKILQIAVWEEEFYGEYRDTSAADTIDRLFKGYFGYSNVVLKNITSAEDIISELEAGNIIISPMNGQALGNPHFTAPGPERHMVLVKGYDYGTEEFITNDPGTRYGQDYRYNKNLFFNAIRDYISGYHEPFPEIDKNIIIIKK